MGQEWLRRSAQRKPSDKETEDNDGMQSDWVLGSAKRNPEARSWPAANGAG